MRYEHPRGRTMIQNKEKTVDLKMMNQTWDSDLMVMLKEAKMGDRATIDAFAKQYHPFAVHNEDYSYLLVFREFKVQLFKDERRVLNARPEDEHVQKGITIVRVFEDGGGSQRNIYLPNNKVYQGISITKEEVTIITAQQDYVTNITEMGRKLPYYGQFTQEDIAKGFESLTNEIYVTKQPKKPIIKHKTIVVDTLGDLTYDEKMEWYEGLFQDDISQKNIKLYIYHTTPKKLEKLLNFAQVQMRQHVYRAMLLAMEEEMITLKNEVWLGEDEETKEEEPLVSTEEFRRRISVDAITFYDDGSCEIYCNDDDLFFGHTIQISVDKKGRYESVALAG